MASVTQRGAIFGKHGKIPMSREKLMHDFGLVPANQALVVKYL